MSAPIAKRRAFAVWFKDLDRWNVSFFRAPRWKWPQGIICPLASVAHLESHPIATQTAQQNAMPLIAKINFGGEVFLRSEPDYERYKGRLFVVAPNRIIFSKINARQGCIAWVPPTHPAFAVSSEYPVFVVDESKMLPRFLDLVLRARPARAQLSGAAAGMAKPRTSAEEFLSLQIPIPPLERQREIVAAWDAVQTLQRDGLAQIQAREREIDADFLAALGLQMPRRAKPRKCFAVWFKDLGRWGVQINRDNQRAASQSIYESRSLREICKIGSGGTPRSNRHDFYGGDIPWVRTTEVRNALITQTGFSITESGLNSSSAKIYPKGSILVAMYGQGATRGRSAKLGMDAATNQACAVLHNFTPEVEADFVWCYLMSQYENLRSLASGNNQPNLNAEMVGDVNIPLPPLERQREIMAQVASARDEVGLERAALSLGLARAKAELERALLGTPAEKIAPA